jgi:beta-lactamase superfamily II metal-dependent hydrolase
MNQSDNTRGSAGINVLWPDLTNRHFKDALKYAEETGNPNNISPIISYSMGKIKFVWMGDLETEYMENIYKNVLLSDVTILFAPHHGRESGKVPSEFLSILNPKLVIIGEAPSKDLNYYKGYNTITQNGAGDITFDVDDSLIDIYVSNKDYSVDFLSDYNKNAFRYYLGTLDI